MDKFVKLSVDKRVGEFIKVGRVYKGVEEFVKL